MGETILDWPDRFVLVTAASRSPAVTQAPLRAVPGRIAGLVILTGVSDKDNPSAADFENALYPAEMLKSLAKHQKIPFHEIIAETHRFSPWTQAVSQALQWIEDGVDIVLNVKAGPKEVVLGAIMGARGKNLPQMHLFSFLQNGGPALATSGASAFELHQLPQEGKPPELKDYIERHSMVWSNQRRCFDNMNWRSRPSQRRYVEDIMKRPTKERSRLVEAINNLSLYHHRGDRTVFDKYDKWTDPSDWFAFRSKSKETEEYRKLVLDLADRVDDTHVDFETQRIYLRRKSACDFLKGGWLELFVFDEVKRACKKHPDVISVTMSVELEDHNPLGVVASKYGPDTIGEIDVAILTWNRLITIECKSGTSGGTPKSMRAMDTIRNDMAGPGGSALFVGPMIEPGSEDSDRAVQSLMTRGLTPILGWTEVENIGATLVDAIT